jgi:hypothetical protein
MNHILQKKLHERDQIILELRANLTTLQNLLFGKSSEQTKNETTDSDSENKGASQGAGKEGKPKGNKGGHKKRRNHEKLPLVEETVDLLEDKKKCQCCGVDFQYMNDVEEGET